MATGRHARPSTRRLLREARWPRRILVGVNVVVVLVLALTGATYGYVRYQFDQLTIRHVAGLVPEGSGQSRVVHTGGTTPAAGTASPASDIPPFTLLAVGTDSRDIAGGAQYQGSGASYVSGQRSDSIMLIRVIPATRQLALLSIPRDLLVEIPGMGRTLINAAFNSGNPSLLVSVLSQDFGIQVNHYAEANFDTFQQLAEAVGGVKIWFPAAGMDANSLFRVGPGCDTLNGSLALAFVRSREYQYQQPDGQWAYQLYPESDLGRIQRQQAFVRLALQKARLIAPTNLVALNALVSTFTTNLTLDQNFSESELLSLVATFRSADLSNIPQYTYPATNDPYSEHLDPDFSAGAGVLAKFLAADPTAQTTTPGSGSPTPASTTTTTVAGAPPTSATTPTTTPGPATTAVAPSSVDVEVANGTGATGQATEAARDLEAVGYHATVLPEVYSPLQSSDVVLYAPDAQAAATQLQAELPGGATLSEDASLTEGPYALELVTGSSFAGVTAPVASSGSGQSGSGQSTPAATTTVPPTTSTTTDDPSFDGSPTVQADSSSYYDGQYVPPGLQPGQPVGHCSP